MANPDKGITLWTLHDELQKLLDKKAPSQLMEKLVLQSSLAIFLQVMGKPEDATKMARNAERLRYRIQREFGTRNKYPVDLALLDKPPPAETMARSTPYRPSDWYTNKDHDYFPNRTMDTTFKHLSAIMPDVSLPLQGHGFDHFSEENRMDFQDEWTTAGDRLVRELEELLQSLHSTLAGMFTHFTTSGCYFQFLRALLHAVHAGDAKYQYTAFLESITLFQTASKNLAAYDANRQAVRHACKMQPTVTIDMEELVVLMMRQGHGQTVPALSTMARGNFSFNTMDAILTQAHAATSIKHAHIATAQIPKGCFLNDNNEVCCAYCHVKSNKGHCYSNCRKRLSDQGSSKPGQGSNRQQDASSSLNKQTQGGAPRTRQQQQASRSSAPPRGSRAHFTAAEDEAAEEPSPAQFAIPPGYQLIPILGHQAAASGPSSAAYAARASAPAAAAGSNQWLPPGQISLCRPQHMAYAHAASPGTRLLDSGASVTTVGSHTHLDCVRPSNIRLHTTSGCTSNTFEGTCTLVFADQHGMPVTLKLPALSSPDIQPSIVLISYHQLLVLGFRIYLTEYDGQIITPANHVIHLTVQDGVWHFPMLSLTAPPCTLHNIPAEVANMVLGRGNMNNPSPALHRFPAPVPAVLPSVPVVEQPIVEQAAFTHDEDDNCSLLGSSRSVSPAPSSSDSRDSSNESSDVQVVTERPEAPLPAAAPAPASGVDSTIQRSHPLPMYVNDTPASQSSLPEAPAPAAFSSPSSPPQPVVRTKRGRPATGWALTTEEAMRICKHHHEANHHAGGRKALQRILYAAIPDKAYRPSTRHIQQFICGSCALAKSKVPDQRKTHPPSTSPSSFLPGEFLYVDGSGAYNFETIGNNTQHFIVTCDASHAKFAFPTKDKKPSTLLSQLQPLQSHWGTKIRKIRTDQEFARSKEVLAWASSNDIAIETTPPYVHQANGKAERAHGIIQDLARTQKIHAGANNLLWDENIRYAAKLCNLTQTAADSQHRSPLQICDNIPFQHLTLQHPPWGCAMYAHLCQSTDCSTAAAPCSQLGVFVGIEDNSRAYRMYDMNSNKIVPVAYADFDVNKFPLKEFMLAGQPYLPNATVDPDSWLRAAHLSLDEATDDELAEFACGSQLVLEVPQSFFPKYKGAWRMQCHRPHTSNKVVFVVCLFDHYHGDKSRLPKDMRDYASKPKDSKFRVSPPVAGQDYSLRHALRLTYPSCKKLSEMAAASTRSKGIYPSHPAVSVAQAAVSDLPLFCQLEQAKLQPASVAAFTAHTAETMRIPPLQQAANAPGAVPAKGSIGFTPKTSRQAQQHPSWPLWKQAEDAEIAGLRKKGVFVRVRRDQVPAGVKILKYRWVYVDKASGPKSRYCARGDMEDPYPPPEETFASTPPAPVVREIIRHAAQRGRRLRKKDVTQAFTQADEFPPDVHIYIEPPEGHEEAGYVWRLLRPLYGLARAPAAWSATLRAWLEQDGWKVVSDGEDTVYTYTCPIPPTEDGDEIMILVFHVDDILLSSHPSCDAYAKAFDARLLARFQGRDEGDATRYIGMDVTRVNDRIYLTQTPLIEELVEEMSLTGCNSTLTPMQPGTRLLEADRPKLSDAKRTKLYQHYVGILQFLTTWTRPDIGFATHELSKHQSNPGEVHEDALKYCVRYLAGTSNYGLVYRRVPKKADRLIGFADSDWAGDTETRKSLSAHVFSHNSGATLWHCKQQQGVATSTSEAEFVSASTAGKSAEWLRRILAGMGDKQHGPTPIYEDNKGCRLMSENSVNKSRTRHIDVSQHKVRDLVRNNVVRLFDCPTGDMVADVLTKALPAPEFRRHRDTLLGYMPHTAPALPDSIALWKPY